MLGGGGGGANPSSQARDTATKELQIGYADSVGVSRDSPIHNLL